MKDQKRSAQINFKTTPALRDKFQEVLEKDMDGMTKTAFFEITMILAIEASRFYHSLPPSVFVKAQQYKDAFPTEPYFICFIKACNDRLLRFFQHLLLVFGLDDRRAEFEVYMQSVGIDPETADDNQETTDNASSTTNK